MSVIMPVISDVGLSETVEVLSLPMASNTGGTGSLH